MKEDKDVNRGERSTSSSPQYLIQLGYTLYFGFRGFQMKFEGKHCGLFLGSLLVSSLHTGFNLKYFSAAGLLDACIIAKLKVQSISTIRWMLLLCIC